MWRYEISQWQRTSMSWSIFWVTKSMWLQKNTYRELREKVYICIHIFAKLWPQKYTCIHNISMWHDLVLKHDMLGIIVSSKDRSTVWSHFSIWWHSVPLFWLSAALWGQSAALWCHSAHLWCQNVPLFLSECSIVLSQCSIVLSQLSAMVSQCSLRCYSASLWCHSYTLSQFSSVRS